MTTFADNGTEWVGGAEQRATGRDIKHLDIDLHLVDLRFSGTRVVEPRVVERLARSIERDGQIVPCVVVPDAAATAVEGSGQLVLIDGYRRVAALRRLGRDTASVEAWSCELAEAVLGVLARSQNRCFAAIEEALLLRELTQGLGLSQHEVARRCGRDAGWVNRRLQLLSMLSDAAVAAVRNGRLSCWAATRVMAPLARANARHAERLLMAVCEAPLTTRELRCWFEHYQKASRRTRERMAEHPHLFLQALNESTEQGSSDRLRDGPEGECEVDLWRINELVCRVRKRLPALRPLSEDLVTAVSLAQRNLQVLCHDVERYAEKDLHCDPRQRADSQGARSEPARDQPPAQTLAAHGTQHCE